MLENPFISGYPQGPGNGNHPKPNNMVIIAGILFKKNRKKLISPSRNTT
jgi:hypothetical protein